MFLDVAGADLAIAKSPTQGEAISAGQPYGFTSGMRSLAIVDAPTTLPLVFRIGEIETDTRTSLPSFARRSVSKCRTAVPDLIFSNISLSSRERSGGTSIITLCPSASSAE